MNTKPSVPFYFLITALCSLGLLSSDMFLPSLPSLTSYFGETPARVQLTLSVFLLGLALFQIVFGALSDTFGRRRVLLAGLVIYAIGTLGCALATSFPVLLACRFAQATGACSGLVLGRAIVADRFGPVGGARILSIVFPFVAMSPALAPIAGGYLEAAFGWRGSFVFLTIYGVLLLAATVRLEESAPSAAVLPSLRERRAAMAMMLRTPAFLAYVIGIACAYGAYFGYVSGSPFILKKMGEGAVSSGYLYVPLAAPYIISALIGRRLAKRLPLADLVRIGLFLTLMGAIALTALAAAGFATRLTLFLPLAVLTAGNGLILPFGSAGAVGLFPGKAGTASGVVGTLQLGTAALVAMLVARVSDGSVLPVAVVVLGVTALGLLGFLLCGTAKTRIASQSNAPSAPSSRRNVPDVGSRKRPQLGDLVRTCDRP